MRGHRGAAPFNSQIPATLPAMPPVRTVTGRVAVTVNRPPKQGPAGPDIPRFETDPNLECRSARVSRHAVAANDYHCWHANVKNTFRSLLR